MASITIPQFLLPRGIPSPRTLHALTRRSNPSTLATTVPSSRRCASSDNSSKPRVLAQPDKFRPPSHPARRVVQTRKGRVVSGPINYPGPRLSEKEKEEQKHRKYPNMFPPEGTMMYKFLTSRWIHIWIAMGVLTSLATFTFTTNFKHTSPYAHLLPPWSALLTHPIDTIGQALTVFRMHVQHNSMETREKRLKRVEDAEKRRQYRIAHGLEEPDEKAKGEAAEVVDDQSPVAVDVPAVSAGEYVDWEGKKRPVKKWLGIW
ncbi:uncharacterized protein CDV56_102577 [Aspergillus thermomutatus]|uniref:Uncharacterized protein n=1 Tax=Aspergillus thermomutatus TaxID=41047 RepID=A0A397H1Z9_ASPTH|nr:uncharacterized protein CDV56_102577 [Aspergillus thermomutatus]RHZ57081.1 hypothetical protein CDV56_102577 [Aspergillus thermomutatus]